MLGSEKETICAIQRDQIINTRHIAPFITGEMSDEVIVN
jgi:hypothetical protein